MRRIRWALAIGAAAALTAGGGAAYAAADDATGGPMTCKASVHQHLHVVDGSGAACRIVVAGLVRDGR